jgi:hypothetical protein
LSVAYRPSRRFVGRVTLVHGGVQSTNDRGWSQHVHGEVRALTLAEVQSVLDADPSGESFTRP